jgi:circadian clock protein KaiB
MKTRSDRQPRPDVHSSSAEFWDLRLYITGRTPNSLKALANLRKTCEDHLKDHYRITVIDLIEQPQRARVDQIVAVPTVVRARPKPLRTLIGNLSDPGKLLADLNQPPPD